jgi:hypothetical protein
MTGTEIVEDFCCPGWGNCAHVEWLREGRRRKGSCHWCEEHPGQPRPPVRGRLTIEFRIVRRELPA